MIYPNPASALGGLTPVGVAALAQRDRELEIRLAALESGGGGLTVVSDYNTAEVTTTSTSYVSHASGRSADIVVGASGMVLVTITAFMGWGTTSTNAVYMSWACSGDATIAPADDWAVRHEAKDAYIVVSRPHIVTGLMEGDALTFATRYRVLFNTSTGRFRDQSLLLQTW